MQFETGKTYWTRSVCDYDCIFTIKVARRSAKFITTDEGKRLGVKTDSDGVEYVFPHGRYSMAAIIRADSGDSKPVDTWARDTEAGMARAEEQADQALPENVISLSEWKARRAA